MLSGWLQFFNPKKNKLDDNHAEKQLLLDQQIELNEVTIVPVNNSVQVSRPRNHRKLQNKNITLLSSLNLLTPYDEIQLAINLFERSKKHCILYQEKDRRRLRFVGSYNVACLLIAPGSTVSVMLMIHSHLADFVSKRMDTLLKMSAAAVEKLNPFALWYDGEINHMIKSYKDPMVINSRQEPWNLLPYVFTPASEGDPTYDHPCYNQFSERKRLWFDEHWFYTTRCEPKYTFIENSHFLNPIPDYCKTTTPHEWCRSTPPELCEQQTKLLQCMDDYASRLPAQQEIKTKFESQHAPMLAELRSNYDHIQASISELNHQSTFEPISMAIFGVSGTLCAAYSIYLYYSWRNANKEYQNYIDGKCGYKDYLQNPHALAYILNLANKLNISLKDKTYQQVIQELQVVQKKAIPKTTSISFFIGASRSGLPDDVIDIILEKMKLLNPNEWLNMKELELNDAQKEYNNVAKIMFPK